MLPTRFVTLAALTLCLSTPAPPAPVARTRPPDTRPAPLASHRAVELYSPHVRRRFAAYMRLRVLELRAAGLAHAADVIERRLPIDRLIPTPQPPAGI